MALRPLMEWQAKHPATNGGILDITNILRARLVPYDVKVLAVIHDAEGTGSGVVGDRSGSWRDILALTEDILRDMFRLPGYDRALKRCSLLFRVHQR